MGELLPQRFGIRHGFAHGVKYKLTSTGEDFSLVIFRKDQPPEYHLELTREQADELLSQF